MRVCLHGLNLNSLSVGWKETRFVCYVFAAVNIEFLFAHSHAARRAAVRQRQFRRHDGDANHPPCWGEMPVGCRARRKMLCVALTQCKKQLRAHHTLDFFLRDTPVAAVIRFSIAFVLFSLRDTYTRTKQRQSFVTEKEKSYVESASVFQSCSL
jgi:hypothetical protein